MENFSARQCEITGGFAKRKQDINASVTMHSVHNCFAETGRFNALKCKKEKEEAHVYWDSDVAKWIEAAAYVLARKEDETIRAWYEEAVCDIINNQLENGYFTKFEYLKSIVPHAIVCYMPNFMRDFVYRKMLRRGRKKWIK